MRVLVQLIEEPRECSYLPTEQAALEYRVIQDLDAAEYELLLARGYRRFGRQLFRPLCASCEKCVSVRTMVREFRPSRSQKRVLKKNERIRVVLEPVYVTKSHLALYDRYHRFMSAQRGWSRDAVTRAEYYESFISGGGDFARQWTFFDGDRLIGVALMDETVDAVSLVYFFHEPDWRDDSPGTFSVLTQLAYANQRGKRYAYPGYWIAENQSMAYKSRFRPFERLVGRPDDEDEPCWIAADPFSGALPRRKNADGASGRAVKAELTQILG